MHSVERVLIRTDESERLVVDPLDAFLLEADGDATRVRLASRHELADVRELGQVSRVFEPFGFLAVHCEFVINPRRVVLLRRRDNGRDCELKLAPPVNRVIPIARDRVDAVMAVFGGR